MPTRTTPLALLLLALAAWPAAGRAQIQSPTPVDDAEPQARPEPAPPRPKAKAVQLDPSPEPGPAPDPSAAGAPDTLPAPKPPPPPPPPEKPAARAIEPVTGSWADVLARWAERRAALREQDPARAAAAGAALLELKQQLAIGNLDALAAAEVREATRALQAHLPALARDHAELAVQLAPDSADARLAQARVQLAASPGAPWQAAGALWEAGLAAAREPHTRRAFYGDLFSALLAAVVTAAAATVLLLLLRSLRCFLHDFHHLPVLRGTAAVQGAFLGLVLLATPLAFGLGPFLVVAAGAAAAWLYLSTSERLAVTAALLAVALLPWAAQGAARLTAWTGSLAEVVHELEHGAPSDEEVAEVAARAGEAPPPALAAALGRHYKRRGDLALALRWYERAQAAGATAAVTVNIGNVRFLQGDLEGAKQAYLEAGDRAGDDLTVAAAAHYDLSRVYVRASDMEKSSAARDRADQEDAAFIRRYGSEDDFSANRYLVDVPVSAARLEALAAGDGAPEAVRDAVQARLGAPLPRAAWPWAAGGLLAGLWLLALVGPRLGPSRACERCGRPACRRCDGAGGPLCGQCVNVYVKRGMVDARDRLRKEAAVRRHQRLAAAATRALAVAGGGAGHVVQGLAGRGLAIMTALCFAAFVVWFWRGVVPPPQPSPYVLWGKLAVAVPAGLAVYLLAVRDAFRRTRG